MLSTNTCRNSETVWGIYECFLIHRCYIHSHSFRMTYSPLLFVSPDGATCLIFLNLIPILPWPFPVIVFFLLFVYCWTAWQITVITFITFCVWGENSINIRSQNVIDSLTLKKSQPMDCIMFITHMYRITHFCIGYNTPHDLKVTVSKVQVVTKITSLGRQLWSCACLDWGRCF